MPVACTHHATELSGSRTGLARHTEPPDRGGGAQRMNDLAEKALHGLDVGRRRIAARPVVPLTVGGFLAAALVVVPGGRIGAAPGAQPLNTWLGLLPRPAYQVTDLVPGLVMLAGIGLLAGLWLIAVTAARGRRVDQRGVWTIAVGWAAPFVVGPPLLSTDVFRYVADGLLARAELNPYYHGPSALGDTALVSAIDPTWRGVPSTQGPLSTALEHVFVIAGADNPLATVVLLRALAVAAVVAIGRLAADLAGRRGASAVALTVLNPATLLFLVSAAHLDAVFVALILAALLAASQGRWTRAVLLCCLATGVKPVGVIAVLAVVAADAGRRRNRSVWRIAGRDVSLVLAVLAACTLSVPYGLGWVGNIAALTREHTPFAPASLVSDLISLIIPSASFDDLAIGGRLSLALAGATAIGYLLVTVRSRALERTIGYGLLAAALCGPVLYPWHLIWGPLVLAPSALGMRRSWVLALSVAACVLAPAGFAPRTDEVVAGSALVVVTAVTWPRLLARYRRTVRAQQRVDAG